MSLWKPFFSINTNDIRRSQGRRLHKFVREQLYPFSPFYHRLFDSHHIKPDDIRTLDDLRRIPFTTKSDFLSSDSNPDGYRSFILQPDQEKIRRYSPKNQLLSLLLKKTFLGKNAVEEKLREEYQPIFMSATTGRSAEPITFFYTKHDIRRLESAGERLLDVFEITHKDRIVNLFPYAPHLAFWQTAVAGLKKGVLTLSTGGGKVMGTAGNIRAIIKVKPTLIIGIPGYIYHLLRTAQAEGRDFSSIKKVILGAEKVTLGLKQKMRELLEQLGAKEPQIIGTYGFTEARMAWGECPVNSEVSSGYHTYPDFEIIEVVNPETGEPVEDSQEGEIVYTNLDARGSCVLRYRTGDVAKGGITYGPCPFCGQNVARISSDIARVSNIKELNTTKIKGTLVNLNIFNEILSADREIDEWQLEIRKKNNDIYELDELILYISPRNGINEEKVKDNLRQQLQVETELTPNQIHVIPLPEILQRLGMDSELKEKRILDLRNSN